MVRCHADDQPLRLMQPGVASLSGMAEDFSLWFRGALRWSPFCLQAMARLWHDPKTSADIPHAESGPERPA
jgi:hypothetical protein